MRGIFNRISALLMALSIGLPVSAQVVNSQFIQAGTGAVSRPFLDKARDSVSVKDFGAKCDGTTNDRAAFIKAFAAAKWISLPQGATCFVGTISDNNPVFNITGDRRGVLFNGAKMTVQTTGGNYNAPLFSLNNLDGFTLQDAWVKDLGFDQSVTWKGISVVRLHPTSGPVRNVAIKNAKMQDVAAALDVDDAAYRAEGLTFDGQCDNVYYCINLANNGDDLFAQYTTKNAVRSYFVYGVKNHFVDVVSDSHVIGNADFLIHVKETSFPTRGIKARFTSKNSQSTPNPQLVISSMNDTGTTEITECDIYYDDRQSPDVNYSIAFKHYNNAGVIQATDPNTKSSIVIRGYSKNDVYYFSTPTQPQANDFRGIRNSPSFMAVKTIQTANATGNGAVQTVLFDTKLYDTHSDYDPATGIFTAPYDGVYRCASQALETAKTAAMTRTDIKLVTSPKTFVNTSTNTNVSYPEQSIAVDATVSMNKGQTAYVQVVTYNGASNTATLYGDSTNAYTYFSCVQLR